MPSTADNPKNFNSRIVRDKAICGGEPVFAGTRVTLRTVLASLANGDSAEDILADFPSLKGEDIRAAIAFAAGSAEEDLPVPAVPHIRLKSSWTRISPSSWYPGKTVQGVRYKVQERTHAFMRSMNVVTAVPKQELQILLNKPRAQMNVHLH